MRWLKLALAAALCTAVALAIWHGVVPRYLCDTEKKRTELWLDTARESGSIDRRIAVARAAIPRLMQCVEHDPADYEALFLLAVARRDAEQREAALRTFEATLALNERPEIHTNVGILQLEQGRLEEARQNLLRAAYFNIAFSGEVDQALAAELYAEVEKRQARLRAQAGR